MDHTAFLGHTLGEIAAEKAGIIKPGRPAVSAPQAPEVMAVLTAKGEPVICSSESVSITPVKRKTDAADGWGQTLRIDTGSRSLPPIRLPLYGAHQRENCAVAVSAIEQLADMLSFEPAYRAGLESMSMKARFERLQPEPLMILDGAHNPSGARALIKTLREHFSGRAIGFILSFLDDKDMTGFLREIRPLAQRVWTVQVEDPRAATAASISEQARILGLGAEPTDAAGAWSAAEAWASAAPDRLVCLTGTLRLAECFPPATPGPAAASGS
jgi:dihydrofolate synthase/folylpolyglutamate synthase